MSDVTIILKGIDQTGPAIGSARGGLASLTNIGPRLSASFAESAQGIRQTATASHGLTDALGSIQTRAVAVGSVLASAFTGAVGILGSVGGQALNAVTSFEKMSATLASMTAKELVDLGQFANFDAALSAATDKSRELLKWTQALAITSPFEEGDVSSALSAAQAFGFLATQYQTVQEAQKAGVITAQRLTNATMNWAAATGKAGNDIQRVVTIAGQVQSIGKLMGGDSMQLKQFGINIEQAIGAKLGKTTQQVIEMREKGLIPSGLALDALVGEMEKFGNAAALQGNTIGGLLASMSDLSKMGLRSLAMPALTALKEPLSAVVGALQTDQVQAQIAGVGNAIGGVVSGMVSGIQSLASTVGPVVQTLASGLSSAMETFAAGGEVGDVLGGIGESLNLPADAVSTLQNIGSALMELRNTAVTLGPALGEIFMGADQADALGVAVSSLGERIGIVTAASSVSAQASSTMGQVFMAAAGVAGTVAGVASTLGAILSGVLASAFQAVGQVAGVVFAGLPGLMLAILGPVQSIAGAVGSILISAFANAGSIMQNVFSVLPGLAGIAMSVLTSLAGVVGGILAGAFQVIAPIAISVFQGIASVIGLALPGLMSLATAVGSLLVAAFTGLQAVAVSVFSAIQPYIPGIQAGISTLAGIIGGALNTAFTNAASFITGTLIPNISTLTTWLAAQMPGAIAALAGFWSGVLVPAIQGFVGWVTGTLLPTLATTVGWLISQIPTALSVLAGFWTGVLWPAITTVATWVTGTLLPMLGQLVVWLIGNIPTALQTLGTFWTGTLLPAITTVWSWLSGTLLPFLGQLATTIGTNLPGVIAVLSGFWTDTLLPAVSSVWGFISDSLWPLLQSLANLLDAVLRPVILKVAEVVTGQFFASLQTSSGGSSTLADKLGTLRSVLDTVGGILQTVAGKINEFATAIRGIQLPDFLQRHSPSPLEQTFTGLASAVPAASSALGGFASQSSALGAAAGMIRSLAGASRELFDIFKESGSGIGGNAPKKLQRLTDSVSSISSAVGDMMSMMAALQTFKADKATANILGDAGFENQILGQLQGLASLSQRIVLAVKPIASGISKDVPESLKVLGDAASAAGGIASSAMAAIKTLTDAIASKADSFDLSAGAAMMTRLAETAVALVRAASTAALAIRDIDTSGLAPLKSATESLAGLASSTLQAITVAIQAMRFDLAAVDFGRARDTLRDLATIAIFFLREASRVALAIKDIDTSGLAPLRSATDDLRGVAESVMASIRLFLDTLKFDFALVNFGQARDRLRDLATIAVFFLREASRVALAIKDIDTSGLGPLRQATDELRGVGESVMSSLRLFLDTLKFDFASVNFGQARDRLRDLVTIAVFFAREAALAALAIHAIDTSGFAPLRASLQELHGAAEQVWSLVTLVSDAIKATVQPLDLSAISTFLVSLIQAGQQLATKAVETLGAWTIDVKPALADLGKVLQDSAGVLRSVLDIANLALGGETAQALTTGTLGPLVQNLTRLIDVGRQLADAANRVIGSWNGEVKAALTNLGQILSNVLSSLKNTFDIIDALQGRGDFAGLSVGDLRPTELQPEYSPFQMRIMSLLYVGKQIATAANAAVANWSIEVRQSLENLGKVLSSVLSSLKNTFDIIDAIHGRGDFGGLSLGDLRPTELQPEYSPFQMRIMSLVFVAKQIAVAANAAVAGWSIDVRQSLSDLGKVLSAALGIIKDTLDISSTLSGDKFPAFNISLLTTRITQVIEAAKEIAKVANTAVGTWTIEVVAGWSALGKVIGDGLDIASKTLDLNALLSGDKFPAFNISLLTTRIEQVIGAAKEIARAANTAVGTWSIEVVAGWAALGKVIADSLDLAGHTLDLNALLSGDKFPAFNILLLTTRITQVIEAAKEVGRTANTAVGTWSIEVVAGWSALGKVIGDGLDVASKTLDLNALLSGDKFPSFNISLLTTRISQVIEAGKEIARTANTAVGTWTIEVVTGWTALGKIIADSLGLAGDTLDLGQLLSGEKFPSFDISALTTRIEQVIGAAKEIARAANTAVGTWSIEVVAGWSALGKVIADSLGLAGDVLDFNSLVGGGKFPSFDIGVLTTRIGQIVNAGKEIAQAANAAIGVWSIEVGPGWEALGKVVGDSLALAGDVLDFTKLGPALANFRGLDMGSIGSKLDLLIANAIAIAQQFGQKAASANIPETFAQAGEQVSALFGDAFSALKDSLDLGGLLLDPETQIPSIQQIQPKLDALFSLITQVGQQFAAKAAALATSGVNMESAGAFGEQIKSVFEGLREVASAVQDFTGIAISASGFNNIRQVLDNVFSLFEQATGRAANINAVVSAISSVLGGLSSLVASSGLSTGESWGDSVARGIRNKTADIQAAIASAFNAATPAANAGSALPSSPGLGGGGTTMVTYNYTTTTYNTMNVTMVASPSELADAGNSLQALRAGWTTGL